MRLLRLILDSIATKWCGLTHGGGHVHRDPTGRVNWRCAKCGRWADPVPLCQEYEVTEAAIRTEAPKRSGPAGQPSQDKPAVTGGRNAG